MSATNVRKSAIADLRWGASSDSQLGPRFRGDEREILPALAKHAGDHYITDIDAPFRGAGHSF